jgi:hypothetical protein
MAVSTVHVLHGIQTPTTFYSQLEEATPSPQASVMPGYPAGIHNPLFKGIKGLKPSVPFRTTQLKTLLLQTGLYGADQSAGNVDLFYRKVTNLGTREADATAAHTRMRMAKAFLYTKSLNARHQGEATAEAEVIPIFDGTNVPIVAAGSVALGGTSSAVEFFGLGPISINGIALPGDIDLTIDFGIELIRIGSASEAYDSFVAIRAINPIITIRSLTIESWASYGIVGAALSSTGFVGYLRKLNADVSGGTAYVSDATAQHIKLSAANGFVAVNNSSGGANNEVGTELKIYPRSTTATASPMSIDTASTIT